MICTGCAICVNKDGEDCLGRECDCYSNKPGDVCRYAYCAPCPGFRAPAPVTPEPTRPVRVFKEGVPSRYVYALLQTPHQHKSFWIDAVWESTGLRFKVSYFRGHAHGCAYLLNNRGDVLYEITNVLAEHVTCNLDSGAYYNWRQYRTEREHIQQDQNGRLRIMARERQVEIRSKRRDNDWSTEINSEFGGDVLAFMVKHPKRNLDEIRRVCASEGWVVNVSTGKLRRGSKEELAAVGKKK